MTIKKSPYNTTPGQSDGGCPGVILVNPFLEKDSEKLQQRLDKSKTICGGSVPVRNRAAPGFRELLLMRQLNNWKLRSLSCRINNTIITPFLPFYGKNMAKYYFGNKKGVIHYSNYLIAEVIKEGDSAFFAGGFSVPKHRNRSSHHSCAQA